MSKFSFKDFTGHDLTLADLNGEVIEGSCFSQETPDAEIFAKDLKATFIDCNLDNVKIPDNCTVKNCSQKKFKVQDDGQDWLVDDSMTPTKPIDHLTYEKKGLPVPTWKGVK